jgi:hypothetical protein
MTIILVAGLDLSDDDADDGEDRPINLRSGCDCLLMQAASLLDGLSFDSSTSSPQTNAQNLGYVAVYIEVHDPIAWRPGGDIIIK